MVSRGLPATVFFNLIFNSLPQIIPTLLPIITGLSIFFVYSRMQTDREMVILQSSGFSNIDLIRPVLGFGIVLTLLSFFFFTIYQALYLIKILRFFCIQSKMTIHQLFSKKECLIP